MAEYRIDDLARASGVSVRNVRVYQDRGLLPPPRKVGRTGWYDEAHLSRLHLIGRMLDRGYTFATISELLTAAHYGLDVKDVLDNDDPGIRWQADRRKDTLSLDELRSKFGDQTTEDNIARSVELGMIVPSGDDFRVSDPKLMEAAEVLVDAEIPLADLLEQTAAVRQDLSDVAARFVSVVADRYLAKDGEDLDLDDAAVSEVAALVNKMRPLAHDAVNALFADAMEAEIAKALDKAASQLESGSSDSQAS